MKFFFLVEKDGVYMDTVGGVHADIELIFHMN